MSKKLIGFSLVDNYGSSLGLCAIYLSLRTRTLSRVEVNTRQYVDLTRELKRFLRFFAIIGKQYLSHYVFLIFGSLRGEKLAIGLNFMSITFINEI